MATIAWYNVRSRLREHLPLLTLGLAIEFLYLVGVLGPFSLLDHGADLVDLGYLTHYQPGAARAVTVGLVGLFLFYSLALILCSGIAGTKGSRTALLVAACFSVTLSFLYPLTATDVYTYAVQGYIAAFQGLNPLVSAPALASNDPFVLYAGQWINSASPYGPLWVDVSRLAVRISGNNIVNAVLVLKLINAGAVVGSCGLLARLVPTRPTYAIVFFGWNPLVQIELVGNGHNDALMIFLLLAALSFSRSRRPVVGVIFLTGSILTKYLTIGALPFYVLARLANRRGDLRLQRSDWTIYLHPHRLARAVPVVLAVIVTAVFLFAPYWVGPATLSRVLSVDKNYLASPSALAILLVPAAHHWLTIARFVILTGIYLWLGVRLLRGELSEAQATYEGLFAMILLAPHFAGWYLAVLVALAAVLCDGWCEARSAIFSFAATLTIPLWAFVWPWQNATMTLLAFHEIIVPLTFAPPLLIAAISVVVKRMREHRRLTSQIALAPVRRPAPAADGHRRAR